jgi:hypothetical protein
MTIAMRFPKVGLGIRIIILGMRLYVLPHTSSCKTAAVRHKTLRLPGALPGGGRLCNGSLDLVGFRSRQRIGALQC